MITAIDFTGSNGSPKSSYSLHYIAKDDCQLNQYQQSIFSVGSVLTKYDSDQKFAVYGFGAKIDKKTSMCFPLTFDDNNVEVDGIDGIMNAYKNSIKKVTFLHRQILHQLFIKQLIVPFLILPNRELTLFCSF